MDPINSNGILYYIQSNNQATVGKGTNHQEPTPDFKPSAVVDQNKEGIITIESHVTSKGITYEVVTVTEWAFAWCNSITCIILPYTIQVLEWACFSNMNVLQEIIIPEFGNLRSIGSQIIYKSYSLHNLTIPKSIIEINQFAFTVCGIKDLYYCGTKNMATLNNDNGFQIHVSPCYKYKTLFGVSELNRDCLCNNFNNCNTRSQIWYQNLNFLLFTISLTPGKCV